MNLPIVILLLAGLVVSALVCVLIRDLLKASIALALVSGLLSMILFLLEAPLAAVFELSVCSGLITVVFISAISMTRVHTQEEIHEKERSHRRRFIALPLVLMLLLGGGLLMLWPHLGELIPYVHPPEDPITAQDMLWNQRQVDLLGQIVIILVGVYGVLIFFKKERETQ